MLEAALQIRHAAQELDFVLLQLVLPLEAPVGPVIADVLQLLAAPAPAPADPAAQLHQRAIGLVQRFEGRIDAGHDLAVELHLLAHVPVEHPRHQALPRLHQRIDQAAGARIHRADGGHFAQRGIARVHQRHQVGQRDRRRRPPRSRGWRARTRSRTSCRMRDQFSAFHGRFGRLQVAVTRVLRPPRGEKSPITVALTGLAAFTTSLQHAVHHVLLKDAQVAVRQQVHLVRLQLQAELVRHVAQHQLAEIRQPGLGTDAR